MKNVSENPILIGFSFDKVYIRIMRYLIISFLLIFNINSYAENQSDQILCLAKNIYHEARGEEDDGKIAVSNVVINRVNSKNFPSDVCSVVYQRNQIIFIDMILKILPIPALCQFSWTCDLKPNDSFNDSKSWKSSQKIAKEVFQGLHNDITDGATHYYNPDKVSTPSWAKELQKTKVIGRHHFYK